MAISHINTVLSNPDLYSLAGHSSSSSFFFFLALHSPAIFFHRRSLLFFLLFDMRVLFSILLATVLCFDAFAAPLPDAKVGNEFVGLVARG
jgi:hypothetical protein